MMRFICPYVCKSVRKKVCSCVKVSIRKLVTVSVVVCKLRSPRVRFSVCPIQCQYGICPCVRLPTTVSTCVRISVRYGPCLGMYVSNNVCE